MGRVEQNCEIDNMWCQKKKLPNPVVNIKKKKKVNIKTKNNLCFEFEFP